MDPCIVCHCVAGTDVYYIVRTDEDRWRVASMLLRATLASSRYDGFLDRPVKAVPLPSIPRSLIATLAEGPTRETAVTEWKRYDAEVALQATEREYYDRIRDAWKDRDVDAAWTLAFERYNGATVCKISEPVSE